MVAPQRRKERNADAFLPSTSVSHTPSGQSAVAGNGRGPIVDSSLKMAFRAPTGRSGIVMAASSPDGTIMSMVI